MNQISLKRCFSSITRPESGRWELKQSASINPRLEKEYNIYTDSSLPCPIKFKKCTISTFKNRTDQYSEITSFKVCKKPIFNPVLLFTDKDDHGYSKSSTSISISERTSEHEISVFKDISDGFALSTFVSTVDPHFICKVCCKVVNKPQECSLCEILVCKYCSNNECPDCCRYSLKKISKFAKNVYNTLLIKCKECSFIGSIKSFDTHKCLDICRSSICQTYTDKEFCSTECQAVADFSRSLGKANRIEMLKMFLRAVQKPEMFLERKRSIREQVNMRRYWYHQGTWNECIWTCCHSCDKYSYGCTSVE